MKKLCFLLLAAFCFTYSYSQQENQGRDFHQLNFRFTNHYRNTTLEPTWPVYEQNFKEEPVLASLPRFNQLWPGESMSFERSANGLKFQAGNKQSQQVYRVFPEIEAPCVLAKFEISDYSEQHTSHVGFAKDDSNYALLSKIDNSGKEMFIFELKQENEAPVSKSFPAIKTNGKPYTLYFFLGNDYFRFMIKTDEGLQHVGLVSAHRSCFTKIDEFHGFSPAFGATLESDQHLSASGFSAGYFEGIGHADIRSVTYENGEPIRNKNGNFYISTSSRIMGKNGGSGGICVYEMNARGKIVRPVSLIVAYKENYIEAGTAAKLVYDRETKEWIYVARAFPSPGGMLHFGKTKQNLLHDGLHLVECEKQKGIVENSLDGDLIKIDNMWYVAYHGGRPRKLHIAESEDLKQWKEINVTATGEGIAIAKKNGDYFIVDATSPTQMDVRKMFNPKNIVGSIKLDPSPGNHREKSGYPWGCIIPVTNGESTRYLMVCFSMDEYLENTSGGIFTYGDIFSYLSDEE